MIAVGYATVWQTEITAPKRGRIRFHAGCFSWQGARIALLERHRPDRQLASTTDGTLRLSEDQLGLRFVAHLPRSSLGERVADDIRSGRLWGCSLGFDADAPAGNISQARLREITLTDIPACPATGVVLASGRLPAIDSLRDAELAWIPIRGVRLNKSEGNGRFCLFLGKSL